MNSKKETRKILIIASTMRNAKVNGSDIKISRTMATVNLVLKLKLKNQKRSKKILISNNCSIVKELVNQKT